MAQKASYFEKQITKDYVYIIDDGHENNMTVTNDAERVVAKITADHWLMGYLHQRIFYQDTDGQIDELVHDGNGRFIRYSAGHEPFDLEAE